MDRNEILQLYKDAIKHLVIFNDEEWNTFSTFLNIRTLNKNEYFVENGKVCSELGFIIKGSVRYSNIIDGQEITGYFSFENSFVTALKSYHTRKHSMYDILTIEKTTFVTISKNDMETMLLNPLLAYKMERFGRLIAENFNILFEDRIKSFVLKTPEERYIDLLKSGQDIIKRVPLQYIAQFIGVTPVSLSRIRKRIF